MKIYGISQNYEGTFDELFFDKVNAEKFLADYVKEGHYDLTDFRVIELEVR